MSRKYTARGQGKSVCLTEALERRRLFANNYAVGNNPNDVVSADFNADGKPDLAVANTGGTTVSILLGRRDGTFNAATDVTVGNAPKSIITGDFNIDGKADLVTANGTGGVGGYSVLLGNGGGGFTVTTTALAFEPWRQVVAADFNGNGVPDLAFSSGASGGNIVILPGAVNGTFGAPLTVSTGLSQAATFGVGDVDADGDADIVVANDSPSGVLSVMKSNNNGTFTNVGLAAGTQPRNVVVRDINADGRGDILFVTTGSPSLNVYISQANGSFGVPGGVAFNTPFFFKVTDVNGDAKPDIVSDSGQIALGNGNGTFGTVFQGVPGLSFANSFNETIADVNADGRPDFVGVEIGTPGNLTVRMGLGDGQFVDNVLAAPVTFTGPARADESVSDDFDNDGILDVAILNSASSGNVLVYKGSGTGTFTLLATRTVGSTPIGLSAGDFNNDGFIDLATANNGAAGSSSVLLNNGDGTFAPALTLAAGGPPSDVAVGDFNGDGKLDIAVSLEGASSVRRWLGNGDGTFGTAADTAVGNGPIDLAVADVNSDGRADLATANNSASGGSTSVLLGTSAGGFSVVGGAVLGGSARAVAFGDFGGDGNLDLAVGTDGNGGRYHILIGNGAGGFAFSAAQAEVGTTPTKIAAGDFNNDGKTDLVTGDGNTVRLLLGNGAGAIASLPPIAAASSAFTVTPGDYNGDGKLDVISSQFTGSTVNVLLNQTPGPLSPLAAVSGGVLTATGSGTATVSETRGQITLVKNGVTQYLNASAVRSVVANDTQLTLNSDLGRSGGMRNVALTLTGSTNSTSTSFVNQHLTTLTLQDTADLLMRGGNFHLLRVTGLAVASGAQLDLGTADLLYDYSGTSPQTTVRNLLVTGRGNGTWNGFAGIFSINAFQNTSHDTTLGYLEAATYKALNGANATFAGEAIDNTAVVVRYTYYGDTDLDRGVSINDFNRLAGNFGVASSKLWFDGDFDYDGGVSINDFNLLAANFGKTLAAPAPAPRGGTGVAPTKVVRR